MDQGDNNIQEALEKSNREWRITFDAISDPVSLIDVEGKILKCNKAMAELVEKPFNQVVGRTCWELVHNATEPIDGCPFTRMRETLHRESLTLPVEDLFFEVTVDPIFDANGEIITAAHIMKDVTQEKRTRDALKESEEKYKDFVEGTDDLITRIDENGIILYANYRSGKIFGPPPKECIGLSAFDFLHPDDRMQAIRWFNDLIRRKARNGTIENRQVNRNGEVYHMLWSCRFHFDDHGNILYINGVARDITDRKRIEAAVRKREALYRRLVEGLGDNFLMFVLSLEGKLLYISPSVSAMFGRDPEPVRGKHWREIARWTQASVAVAEEKIAALIRGKSFNPSSTGAIAQA